MADRSDPKLSVLPLSDQGPAPPAATSQDQLTELARVAPGQSIVEPAPGIGDKTPVSSDSALAKDLRAKLLNDLEALSSAFYSHPVPAPSTPHGEPVRPVPKPAAIAPPAELQPTSSAASAPVAPTLAAASLAQVEKAAPTRAGIAMAVPSRSERRASPVSLPRPRRRSPEVSPADRPPLARQLGTASGQTAKQKPELAKAPFLSPASTDTATAGLSGVSENGAVKSPATTSDPSRFASAAHRATLFRPEVAQPQEDESPKVASSGGNPVEEGADPREDRDALAPYAEEGEVAEQNLRWTGPHRDE